MKYTNISDKQTDNTTNTTNKLPIITDVQIIEGIVASTVFVFFVYIFRYKLKSSYKIYLSIPWFLTWIFRKWIPNVYKFIKVNYLHLEPVHTIYM